MSLVNIFIMTSFIGVIPSAGSADNREKIKAMNAIAKAMYVQSDLDIKVREIEKKYVPKQIRENAWIIITAKMIAEQEISYQITF